MRILIIGSGGREHALAWKIVQSPHLTQLFMTSSNASVASLQKQYRNKVAPPVAISEGATAALVQFAVQRNIDIVLIGSEAPLAAGLTDAMQQHNIRVFGPTQAAAQIETSKVFAKDFMARQHIPTARYAAFSELNAAVDYLHTIDYPVVIKASGLAAGKGVFLPDSQREAINILQELLAEHTLGAAGAEIIIEERLIGEEVSLLAFCDGYTVKLMPPARDHKRLLDNNAGPNTGGMGAYAPAYNICSPELVEKLGREILQATVDGLRAENKLFVGVLYAGLMLTPNGPRVLEFNARFGDPETQVLMALLDSDLLDILDACTKNQLASCPIAWKAQYAVCVVLASAGYPQNSLTGFTISGLENKTIDNCQIFHAGTSWDATNIINTGGRVLGLTAWDDNLTAARTIAYANIATLHFNGMQFRSDIAQNL